MGIWFSDFKLRASLTQALHRGIAGLRPTSQPAGYLPDRAKSRFPHPSGNRAKGRFLPRRATDGKLPRSPSTSLDTQHHPVVQERWFFQCLTNISGEECERLMIFGTSIIPAAFSNPVSVPMIKSATSAKAIDCLIVHLPDRRWTRELVSTNCCLPSSQRTPARLEDLACLIPYQDDMNVRVRWHDPQEDVVHVRPYLVIGATSQGPQDYPLPKVLLLLPRPSLLLESRIELGPIWRRNAGDRVRPLK
jgi:hypothetical protein